MLRDHIDNYSALPALPRSDTGRYPIFIKAAPDLLAI